MTTAPDLNVALVGYGYVGKTFHANYLFQLRTEQSHCVMKRSHCDFHIRSKAERTLVLAAEFVKQDRGPLLIRAVFVIRIA